MSLRTALLCLAAVLLAACDDAATTEPTIELYIDGALAPESPAITFPNAVAGRDQVAAQLELKNLGPGAIELEGAPPVRIEKDDRLAFSVVQTAPGKERYAVGESVVLSIIFRPHAPGRSDARVVIDIADRDPLVVDLVGEGIDPIAAAPVLGVKIDGDPVDGAFDFGAVPTGELRTARLALSNVGTGTLILAATDAVVATGSSAFTVAPVTDGELAAGETIELDIGFFPESCAAYESSLTIRTATPSGEVTAKLRGRGGTNPQGYLDVTEPYEFGPDGDVALSDITGGVRRFAVGNLSVGNFKGNVTVLSWDGCTLTSPKTSTPSSIGVDAQLLGSQVALDDRGTLLMMTARDYDEAWLYELGADNAPRRLAALATFEPGRGHGKGAALAGNGGAAFIGIALADSGFDAHGAVLAYARPAGGWVDLPEARWKLWPSNPTRVTQLGTWVDTSADGLVVVAGGFETEPGAPAAGPPIVYLWEGTTGADDPMWGRAAAIAEPDARAESIRLEVPDTVSSDHAAAIVSRDGGTVALVAGRVEGGVDVHVWTRGDDTWTALGIEQASLAPTATLFSAGDSNARAAFVGDATALIVASRSGAREIVRPAAGWDASAVVGRSWSVPHYGPIAVSPDGAAFGGVDSDGGAWLVYR